MNTQILETHLLVMFRARRKIKKLSNQFKNKDNLDLTKTLETIYGENIYNQVTKFYQKS